MKNTKTDFQLIEINATTILNLPDIYAVFPSLDNPDVYCVDFYNQQTGLGGRVNINPVDAENIWQLIFGDDKNE